MSIKIKEYHIEHDSVEILYSIGNKNSGRVVTLKVLSKLLTHLDEKTLQYEESSVEAGMVREIRDRGGMEWIRDQIDSLIEL